MTEKTGMTSAPSVWIKGTFVGGCDDGTEPWHGVKPMLSNVKFDELIHASCFVDAVQQPAPAREFEFPGFSAAQHGSSSRTAQRRAPHRLRAAHDVTLLDAPGLCSRRGPP